jgi:hypothetical protein
MSRINDVGGESKSSEDTGAGEFVSIASAVAPTVRTAAVNLVIRAVYNHGQGRPDENPRKLQAAILKAARLMATSAGVAL